MAKVYSLYYGSFSSFPCIERLNVSRCDIDRLTVIDWNTDSFSFIHRFSRLLIELYSNWPQQVYKMWLTNWSISNVNKRVHQHTNTLQPTFSWCCPSCFSIWIKYNSYCVILRIKNIQWESIKIFSWNLYNKQIESINETCAWCLSGQAVMQHCLHC